jgi:hypothetical protein
MADRGAVLAWVAHLRAALLAAAPQPDVDWRLRTVAALLREDLACRLSVGQLAERARWSPEHLRKAFREVAGMSLSRYQMWSRLHRLVDAQRIGLHDTPSYSAEDSLLEASTTHPTAAVPCAAISALPPALHCSLASGARIATAPESSHATGRSQIPRFIQASSTTSSLL